MKIAILILAHKNREQLLKLVAHLEQDFRVYVHIDRRSRWTIPESENVHVLKNRYATYWGSSAGSLATLELYRQAFADNCDYYMLISGQDLPLMSNDELMNFVHAHYEDRMDIEKLPRKEWFHKGGTDRLALYWETKYESNNRDLKWITMLPIKIAFKMLRWLQQLTGLRRKIPFELWGGEVWSNLTKEAVAYILNFLEKNPWYYKHFKFSRSGDELFFHTLLAAFNYAKKGKIVNDFMRYIDWKGPPWPRTLTMQDYDNCMKSGKLFGRKFDMNIDAKVVDKILLSIRPNC